MITLALNDRVVISDRFDIDYGMTGIIVELTPNGVKIEWEDCVVTSAPNPNQSFALVNQS